jgi:hypothetical protein
MEFYRYTDVSYENGPKIELSTFKMIKETPCGWWILQHWDSEWYVPNENKRWVSKTARKRYAYPTKKEAMTSFEARKIRHLSILKAQALYVENVLDLIEKNEMKYDLLLFKNEYEGSWEIKREMF